MCRYFKLPYSKVPNYESDSVAGACTLQLWLHSSFLQIIMNFSFRQRLRRVVSFFSARVRKGCFEVPVQRFLRGHGTRKINTRNMAMFIKKFNFLEIQE